MYCLPYTHSFSAFASVLNEISNVCKRCDIHYNVPRPREVHSARQTLNKYDWSVINCLFCSICKNYIHSIASGQPMDLFIVIDACNFTLFSQCLLYVIVLSLL